MQKIPQWLVLIMMLSLFSCKKDKTAEKHLRLNATQFLQNYYQGFFKSVEPFCDQTTKDFIAYLDKKDNAFYRASSLKEIDSIVKIGKDTARVFYQYFNLSNTLDTNSLLMVFNKKWLAHIENKNDIDFYKYVYDYSLIPEEQGVKEVLTEDEKTELNRFLAILIKQINHPKMVVGILNKEAVHYFDIPDIENYREDYTRFWREFSNFAVYASLEFNNGNGTELSEINYFISEINRYNNLGYYNYIKKKLIEAYGMPYHLPLHKSTEQYVSLRWFIKGYNEMLELRSNKDGTINIEVYATESPNMYQSTELEY